MDAMTCCRCGATSHPDAWDDIITCHQCRARLVRRTEIGHGWEALTSEELERIRIIDLEWHAECDKYKISNLRLPRASYLPSMGMGLVQLVIGLAVAGLFFYLGIVHDHEAARRNYFIMGVAALLILGGTALYQIAAASTYQKALQAYRQRRLDAVLPTEDTHQH